MDKLTIIVHGRSASTLVLRMLYDTGFFKLWGNPPSGECTPFRNRPHTWNRETIAKEWRKFYEPGDHVLAKLPAFAFFIDEILVLEPSVIVMERSILDIICSYVAVGWASRVQKHQAMFGIDQEAVRKYEELGGALNGEDPLHLLGVVFAYSHWKTKNALMNYPKSFTIHYQELMSQPAKVFIELEKFMGLSSDHRDNWHNLMKHRHQSTGRPFGFDYQVPLLVDMSPNSMRDIEDAIKKFGVY